MRALITGVAGFIGSNVAATMLERGYHVVGVDNMSQGDERNLTPLIANPRFSMHRIDIRDGAAMATAGDGCGLIIHLAAFKIPRYSDAMDTLLVNAVGSEEVAKLALAQNAKVVAASTSDVYGKNPKVPFAETDDMVMGPPTVRRWAYAISKMFEEQLLMAYHERHGLDVVVIRLFGGYGPNQNMTWWGGPQSVFINCALEDREMEIHGDGQQTRSFTYIDDHVDGILRAAETPTGEHRVFNIGATREITIEGLARLVWNLVRGEEPAKMRFIPYETFGRYEDVRRRIPDITRAREVLGFTPQTDLETGLRRTIAWQIARRQAIAAKQ